MDPQYHFWIGDPLLVFIFFYLFIFSFWRNLQYHKLTYNLAEYKVLPYFRSEFEKKKGT